MEIQLNGGEITQKKQLNKIEREASKPCTQRRMSFNTNCPNVYNRIQHGGLSDLQLTSSREGPVKQRPNNNQNPKTYREPKLMTAQDQRAQEIKEMAPLNPTGILP